MMIVDLEVALAIAFKIKQAVTSKQIKHVIEKRQAGVDVRPSTAVEVKDDTHVCLFCLAVDFRYARLSFCLCLHNHPIGRLNQPAMESSGKDGFVFSVQSKDKFFISKSRGV